MHDGRVYICTLTNHCQRLMKHYRIEALILAAGLLVLGLFIYLGLSTFAARDRVVSVRGLAEREVKADHVIWPLVYKTTGNDLQSLNADIDRAGREITRFLTAGGIPQADISLSAPQIFDRRADNYTASSSTGLDRYNVTLIVTVSTDKVDLVRNLMSRSGELLNQGIGIAAGDYGSQVQYKFNGLNKIKPQMIQEATKNARQAAEKFANDSESRLGKIKDATQGLFTIEDRDQYTPYIKNVRVVTSVDFYLDN